jgi:hypothetical protein
MHVAFDTLNVYYLPQYTPVLEELRRRGHEGSFVCYKNKNDQRGFSAALEELGAPVSWFGSEEEAARHYSELHPEWIIFGSGFDLLDRLDESIQSVQLGHGVGPKPSYYNKSNTPMSVRFIEGAARLKIIQERYPEGTFVQSGFSKLDPLFNGTAEGLDLGSLGLNPERQTILYAPTFNPSSIERFPSSWPNDFPEHNVLIKPHTFTYTRSTYRGQRKLLRAWERYPNTHVATPEELSLLPYMHSADILLSEASSTLFEFAALDRPVVVCDFFKLKWTYRGPFQYRFERRFRKGNIPFDEIGVHASSYRELLRIIPEQLASPEQYREQRARYTFDHVGPTDGRCSGRIVDYLEENARSAPVERESQGFLERR